MSIRTLKTFLAVAKHGTFAGAAKEIGLTQAAVSSQMRTLESELRTTLFDRTRRSVVMNTTARNLMPRATEIVSLYGNMAAAMHTEELAGRFTLGAIPPTFVQMLPNALSRLKQDHPRVEFRVVNGVSSELTSKVDTGELDAALVAEPPIHLPKAMIWHPILREPFVLIAPKHVRTEGLRNTLARHPFIRVSRLSWTGRLVEQILHRHKIKVTDIMELDSLDAIKEMVSHGFGVSIIPLQKDRWHHDSRFHVLPLERLRIYRTIGLIERTSHIRARVITALLDCLLAR